MAKVLEFPNPVNETSARLVAGGVVAMVATTVVADQPWLMVPLTYGFAARVLSGPRFSPLAQLVTRVITPRIEIDHKLVPGPPKRLAQAMGLTMSATALLLHYRYHRTRAAYRVLSVLLGAAGLEAFFGICLACKMFPLLVKAGVVSDKACEQCNDIWSRNGSGDGAGEEVERAEAAS
jgi:Domain of unknown function (DUF4395)